MPVPVSVTNPNGKGLVAAAPSSLPTEGPFARLKAAAAANTANGSANGAANGTSQAAPMEVERPVQQEITEQPVASTSAPASIEVRGLNFAYPGLGKTHPCAHTDAARDYYRFLHFVGLGRLGSAELVRNTTTIVYAATLLDSPGHTSHITRLQAPYLYPDPIPYSADGRPIPGVPPLLRDLTFSLPPGSTCLLLGANGAGKTTFMKILGGTWVSMFIGLWLRLCCAVSIPASY